MGSFQPGYALLLGAMIAVLALYRFRRRRTRRVLPSIACAQRPIFGCGRQRRGNGKPA